MAGGRRIGIVIMSILLLLEGLTVFNLLHHGVAMPAGLDGLEGRTARLQSRLRTSPTECCEDGLRTIVASGARQLTMIYHTIIMLARGRSC
jgi:hypothetical protein